MKIKEFTGKTTQEAIDNGLAELGVTLADVHVDVLQEGAKGLFGLFGSKPACVRLTVMDDEREDDHGLSDLLGSFSLSDQKKKSAAKPAAPKPIKEALSKSGLVAHIAEATAVAAKDVRAVLASLESAVHASVNKKGAGAFTLPGLLKITVVNVPAKPKRKGINPFTKEEQTFAAKPASVKVKVRPLKKLKDAAA